jgi:hypothetical protein
MTQQIDDGGHDRMTSPISRSGNQPMQTLFRTLFFAGTLILSVSTMAEATNFSTGEPCNLGIFDAADKQEIFRRWVLPPTIILIVSAMVGLLAQHMMRTPENSDQRRTLGLVAGISLAIFVTSIAAVGAIFFIDAFKSEWMY